MNGADAGIVARFRLAAREFQQAIENDQVAGLSLLRRLRETLVDLYAVALRLPASPPATSSALVGVPLGPMGSVRLPTNEHHIPDNLSARQTHLAACEKVFG